MGSPKVAGGPLAARPDGAPGGAHRAALPHRDAFAGGMWPVQDVRIRQVRPLIPPAILIEELPGGPRATASGFLDTQIPQHIGDLTSCIAARSPHWFPGLTPQGGVAILQTSGNDTCHVILRGGAHTATGACDV